jgi:integrase
VGKDPVDVVTADVLVFIKAQRAPRRGATVVRIEDGEAGLSARTIKRRLATIAGLYEYLIVRGDTGVSRNPVPRGLAQRRVGQRAVRGVPLIRAPRTLPRVIDPDEANAFVGALRTHRDRAMIAAMLLGGLRRCEVLGLRLEDLRPGEKRCSSPRARAAINGSCRSRIGSSRRWPTISRWNGLARRRPTRCSSC